MPKKSTLTEEEKRESIKNDINFNMFVEAGAGAGKTTILIDRIINQFKSGEYKPENIVAITFTKKAAEELKGRMVKYLRKASNEESDSKKKGYLKDALMNLDKMQLSTIHSFCFKLLMERAFDAKLRMDVSMLEEGDVDQDKKNYFSAWMKSKDRDYNEFLKLKNLGIRKYYDVAFNAFSMMVDLPEDVVIEIDKKVLKKNFEDLPVVYKKDKDGNIAKDTYGNSVEDDESQEYRDRKEYQSYFVLNYVMPAVEGYRKKHDSHYISNNQLLIKARDLLKNEDVKKYYRKKYKSLYVDEFQDTDKVQVDLVFSLCGDDNDGLRDGSLFVVGDPKQSIYRFRGADIPLYLAVKEKMSKLKNTKVYELNYNYRTHKDVLDFVNYNAKRELQNYSDMNSQSKSNECSDKKQLKGVYYLSRPNTDGIYENTKIKKYKKELEIEYLIAIINGLRRSKAVIYDRNLNDGKGGVRQIEYRDFLILCKTTSSMDEYMAELMKNGIPVQISSNVNIDSNQIFARIKDIYALFAYPFDKKSKEAFAQAYYDGVFTKDKYNELRDIIDSIYSKTKGMDAYTKLLYLSHNIDLYNDNNKNIRADILKRTETQVEQMVETVISTCNNNEQDVYNGICNFIENGYEREIVEENDVDAVRFMNLHKSKGLEGKIVIVCKRTRMMGHEFTNMHLPDKRGIMHYHLCLEEKKGFQSIYYPTYYNNQELMNMATEEEQAENKRLAYVECTRPMEAIIFMDLISTKTDLFTNYDFSMAKNLFDEKVGYPELFAELANTKVEAMKPVDYTGDQFILESEDTQREYTFKRTSPSEYEKYEEATEGIVDKEAIKVEKVEKSEIRGAIYGTTMHRAFELLFNEKKNNIAVDDKKILEIANKATIENLPLIKDEYLDDYERIVELFQKEILDDLEKMQASEAMNNIFAGAKTYYTEYPFDMQNDDGNYIKGKADLIVENNDGTLTIVDYKSDYNPGLEPKEFAKMLEARYKGQIEMYKKSFAKIYDMSEDNIKTYIYNKNK